MKDKLSQEGKTIDHLARQANKLAQEKQCKLPSLKKGTKTIISQEKYTFMKGKAFRKAKQTQTIISQERQNNLLSFKKSKSTFCDILKVKYIKHTL